jgi:hypothetical protein
MIIGNNMCNRCLELDARQEAVEAEAVRIASQRKELHEKMQYINSHIHTKEIARLEQELIKYRQLVVDITHREAEIIQRARKLGRSEVLEAMEIVYQKNKPTTRKNLLEVLKETDAKEQQLNTYRSSKAPFLFNGPCNIRT